MTGNARTLIRVDISINRPWAVGGVTRTGDEVDMPILVDPRSRAGADEAAATGHSAPADGNAEEGSASHRTAFLPATSLVGSLRRHLGDDQDRWLGPAESTEDNPASPSRIRCLGTQLSGKATATKRITTQIDGRRQAAAQRMLRVEEVVPVSDDAPTVARWWLQLDRSCDRLTDLLDALWSWQPVVGRRRSVGQGEATVSGVNYAELDLSKKKTHLTWWLSERHQWDGVSKEHEPPGWRPFSKPPGDSSAPAAAGDAEQLTASFVVVEPLYLGGGEVRKSKGGRGETHVSQRQIPGSSWKGLFRHRVEHILTVCGHAESDRARLVAALFGSGRQRGSSSSAGERGKLRFHTSVLPEGVQTITRTHVAIDRVTGGALDRSGKPGAGARGGALFSVEAIAADTPVELLIDATAKLNPLERQLLEHVIRDIGDGLVGVGGLTSRGYGTLKLSGSRELPGPLASVPPTRREEER